MIDFPMEQRPRYTRAELRGLFRSEEAFALAAQAIEREGRLLDTRIDSRRPRRLSVASVYHPPAESFLLGRMIPRAKATVVFGPTGVGKSALLSQLVFAVASGEPSLWGLALGAHGPVLVVSAEDTFEDWERKAGAVHHGTEIDVESASEDVHVLALSEGEARLSEVVTVRDGDTSRRVSRPTELRDRIIDDARQIGAVLVLIETASRLVEDEDNASFSALQSALGHIAEETGAAVIVTHHATKAASREGDSSIEAARGGGSLIANARNALSLFPAEPDTAKHYADRFSPSELFELHHGKSTSSTKRQDSIVLARVGTAYGAVFHRPEDIEASPEQAAAARARAERERARRFEQFRALYSLVENTLPIRPQISPSWLAENRHADLGITKRAMEALVEAALKEGVLRVGSRSARGVTITLGFDPRRPINTEEDTR